MSVEPHEARLRLPDGRRLAWLDSGPPEGFPVLHFHGSASSRLEPAPGEGAHERLGLRLLRPDRPGYGRSDPAPGRTLRDWADDCARLGDHLGRDRMAVSGWSAGAVHALACAAFHPDRFAAAALLSPVAPLDRRALAAALPADCRRALAWGRRAPGLVRAGLGLVGPLLRLRPELSLRWLERHLPAADREPFREPDLRRRWRAAVREAWRQGTAGAWADAGVLMHPWGFRVEEIRVPVHLWHGTDDRLTPPEMARWLAERLPDARVDWLEGAGHAAWLRHGERILAELVSAVA